MDECEANMAASAKHAQNERNARQQVADLERRMATLRFNCEVLMQLGQKYVTLAISIRIVTSFSFVRETSAIETVKQYKSRRTRARRPSPYPSPLE